MAIAAYLIGGLVCEQPAALFASALTWKLHLDHWWELHSSSCYFFFLIRTFKFNIVCSFIRQIAWNVLGKWSWVKCEVRIKRSCDIQKYSYGITSPTFYLWRPHGWINGCVCCTKLFMSVTINYEQFILPTQIEKSIRTKVQNMTLGKSQGITRIMLYTLNYNSSVYWCQIK